MCVPCSLAPELFFLRISIVNPFVFIVVVHVTDPRHSKFDCLLILQTGTAHEHVVFPVYGAPDGECDRIISALELVTNVMKGNKLGVVVQGFTERSENRLAGAFGSSIAVDPAKGMDNRKTTRNSSARESITSTSCSPRDGTDTQRGFELLRQMFRMRTEREKEWDSITPTTHARMNWEERQRSIRIIRRGGRGPAASCTEGGPSDNEF